MCILKTFLFPFNLPFSEETSQSLQFSLIRHYICTVSIPVLLLWVYLVSPCLSLLQCSAPRRDLCTRKTPALDPQWYTTIFICSKCIWAFCKHPTLSSKHYCSFMSSCHCTISWDYCFKAVYLALSFQSYSVPTLVSHIACEQLTSELSNVEVI